MKITAVQEAKTNLSQLIEAVLQGEDVIISEQGKGMVKLIPYNCDIQPRTPGSWQGQVKMSEDFDTLPDEIINDFMGD
jgi:prevent-host-death family protein